MAVLERIKNFFGFQQALFGFEAVTSLTIVQYLIGLITDEQSQNTYQEKLDSITHLELVEREKHMLALFFELERYLVSHVARFASGKQAVREELRSAFRLEQSSSQLAFLVLDDFTKKLKIYEDVLSLYVRSLASIGGMSVVRRELRQALGKSFLQAAKVSPEGVSFQDIKEQLVKEYKPAQVRLDQELQAVILALQKRAQHLGGNEYVATIGKDAHVYLTHYSSFFPFARKLASFLAKGVGMEKGAISLLGEQGIQRLSELGLQEIIEKGRVSGMTMNATKKDGTKIPLLISGSLLKNEYQETQGIVVMAKDISEILRLQQEKVEILETTRANLEQRVKERTAQLSQNVEELEKAKKATLNILEDLKEEQRNLAKFKQAVVASTDAVIMTTPDQKIAYCNEACERILGYTTKETLGKDVSKFVISPTTLPEVLEKMQKTITAGRAFVTEEMIMRRKNGKDIPVQLSIYPIQEDGNVQFFVGLIQDIAERKAVDKAKTEFVSLASHQLRTPLSTINWYSEMLLAGDAGKLSKEQKKYLQEIYNGNQRMVELVNALLNVSRIELGTFVVEPEPTDLAALSKDIVQGLESQIFQKKLAVKEQYEKDIPKVNVDPKLLRIVVENLLSNSVKYTPEKGSVTLSLKKEKDNILIVVKDTGYGIPKEQQDKVFSKLFRADNIRDKSTEGTGLGLYIIKAIVDQAQGKIWFESKENKGTAFFVQLPLAGMKKKTGTRQIT